MSVSLVGLNNNTYIQPAGTVNSNASDSAGVKKAALSSSVIPQSTNTYENDILMQGIDFTQVAKDIGLIPPDTPVPQQTQTQQVPQQVPQRVPQQASTSYECTPANVPQVNGQNSQVKEEKSTKVWPIVGTVAGMVAPFIFNKVKLGKYLTKDLMLKVPIMAAGGLCVGGIAQGLTTSAKKLEANNAEANAKARKMDVKA